VRAARAAAGDTTLIAGSVGPSGRILKPYGDADPAALRSSFERQAAALGGAGADLVVVETMTDLREALLALEAVRNVSPGMPVAVTLTFDLTPRGHFTIMGQSLEKVCDALGEAGADLVGSNCGVGIDAMIEVSRAMRSRTNLPLMIQPNAGLPRLEGGEAVYPETAEYFGQRVGALLDHGVNVIGGCCGTAPGHIRAIRSVIDTRRHGA
jgi:5-methyltetrahydrofolate--homocysteine methyltransferase